MENSIFETGSVKANYIKLSIPLVLNLMMSVVYNMADTYFISFTQNTNLVAGVSICVPIFTLLMSIGNIFGQGGSSIISRLIGQNDFDKTKHVGSYCFYGSIILGIILGALLIVLKTPVIYLLGADATTFSYAYDYYFIIVLGAPFISAHFALTNTIRSEGLAKDSMIAAIAGILLNIVLDPIFISVLHMGAAGAAIATVLGYVLSTLLCLFVLIRKSNALSVNPKLIKIEKEYQGQIFGIGISAALSNVMQSICIIIINQFLLSYGNDAIAAMGIAYKVVMIALLLLTGFAFGGQPIISYFYGANKTETLKELVRFAFTFMLSLALVITIILEIIAPYLIGAFLKDPKIVSMGTQMFRLQIISMVFVAIVLLINIIFMAYGKVASGFILSILRQGIVFIVVIFVCANLFGYWGIITSQAIADVLTATIAIVLYKRMK